MNPNNVFDFSVNKENRTVNVNREINAPRSGVWSAWTEPEILDQWWAPKPWKSKTKSMDFREGGQRIYTMVGPEGEEHWSLADFKSITPETEFKFIDGFCDRKGNIISELPRSVWNVHFNDKKESTIITITIKHDSLSDLDTILKMGFKEGFTMVLDQLEELLSRNPER